jgi:hypothetical protein
MLGPHTAGLRGAGQTAFDYIITHQESGDIVCKGFTRHCAVNLPRVRRWNRSQNRAPVGDLSDVGAGERRAVIIHGPSCWADHRFQDRAVLPAVEAMQLLADECQRCRPAMNVHRIGRARFDKFLALPPDGGPVDAYCDLALLPDGGLRTALLTRVQARSARDQPRGHPRPG